MRGVNSTPNPDPAGANTKRTYNAMDAVYGGGRSATWLAAASAWTAALTVGVLLAQVGVALVSRSLIAVEGLEVGVLATLEVLGIGTVLFAALLVGLRVYPAVRGVLRAPLLDLSGRSTPKEDRETD